jgi:hypothetical protein
MRTSDAGLTAAGQDGMIMYSSAAVRHRPARVI